MFGRDVVVDMACENCPMSLPPSCASLLPVSWSAVRGSSDNLILWTSSHTPFCWWRSSYEKGLIKLLQGNKSKAMLLLSQVVQNPLKKSIFTNFTSTFRKKCQIWVHRYCCLLMFTQISIIPTQPSVHLPRPWTKNTWLSLAMTLTTRSCNLALGLGALQSMETQLPCFDMTTDP